MMGSTGTTDVLISDPTKVPGTLLRPSYMTYKVTITATATATGVDSPHSSVIRRYSDFERLFESLVLEFPGAIIPPIPAKQAKGRFDNDFVEARMRGFEQFLVAVIDNSTFVRAEALASFLGTASLALAGVGPPPSYATSIGRESEMSRPSFSSSATSRLRSSWLSRLGKKVAIEKSASDFQVEEILTCVGTWEKHLSNILKHADALVCMFRDSAAPTRDLGGGLSAVLATTNYGENSYSESPVVISSMAAARLNEIHAKGFTINVVEPLQYMKRMCASVRIALGNQSDRKSAYIDALTDLDERQSAYNKTLGTPGKEAQLAALQEQLIQSQMDVDASRREYLDITSTLIREFGKFKDDLVADFENIGLTVVDIQAGFHKKSDRAWRSVEKGCLVPDLAQRSANATGRVRILKLEQEVAHLSNKLATSRRNGKVLQKVNKTFKSQLSLKSKVTHLRNQSLEVTVKTLVTENEAMKEELEQFESQRIQWEADRHGLSSCHAAEWDQWKVDRENLLDQVRQLDEVNQQLSRQLHAERTQTEGLKARLEKAFQCSVCWESDSVDHVLIPCGHAFCGLCVAERIRNQECPICSQRFHDSIKFFHE